MIPKRVQICNHSIRDRCFISYAVMRPTTVLTAVFLLSLFLATNARLRNKDETTSCENEVDFECEPGVCIDASLKCNSAYDCASMADETVQLCGCPSGEFQCFNSCIPLEKRCNRHCDCQEDQCPDEEHCDTFPCLPGFQKCTNHICVSAYNWCDFYDDCGDMSDEEHCLRPDCWQTQFRCANEQCINSFFVCDGIRDCADGSDEDKSTCSEDKFADCGDGTLVHKHNFCDGYPDCPANEADETGCNCHPETDFQCANGRCLSLAKVCDLRCDCLNCEDEADCDNQDCNTDNHIFCPSIGDRKLPRCLRKKFLCDGNVDCDGTSADEQCLVGSNGTSPDCSTHDLVGCGGEDQRCLPPFTECNEMIDCLAGTDEKQNCSVPRGCLPNQFQCQRGGACLDMARRCDAFLDCFDGSDEQNCESHECPPSTWKCAAGHCIIQEVLCDYHQDCYYFDNGKKDISDEVNCTYRATCRDDEFRCRSGQCIQAWRHCFADRNDDFGGCADKSHLRNCRDFVCPLGSYKCSRSHCIDWSLVCDRHVDCIESWDDEAPPNKTCSQDCSSMGCNCTEMFQYCTNLGLNETLLDLHSHETRFVINFYLRGNDLHYLLEDEKALKGLERTVLLDLSDNGISRINSKALLNVPMLQSLILADNHITVLENHTFSSMWHLKSLILNGNSITTIKEKAFVGLLELTTLDLSGQNISLIYKGVFEGLNKLSFLNLSHNSLADIPRGAFFGLKELNKLDVSHNPLQIVHPQAFFGLPKLRILHTDEFRFCCMVRDMVSLEECTPPPDEFSSCEDLMANVFLRGSIWVIGIIATVGNLVVIMMRMNSKRDNRVHSFLITNLALGDFCMGVYLLIIASVDVYYRGYYIMYDSEWRRSGLCRFAGFLSTFSSELSVFSLTIITLHRLFSILFPFRIKDMEFSGAVRVMVIAWLLVIFLSAFPLVSLPYFENYYGRSGVCLALHITRERPAGWEYSVFIFLVLNFVSFAVIAASYSVMFVVARRTQRAVKRSRDANTGDAMARRMTVIVMTDFVCWVPIILLGVASLGGAYIPPRVYAWVAIFVLPVNSAVNPMLYTLLTAPYVRRVMSRARTSLNLSLATMTTDMKQVNSAGDRQSRMSNGRQGWQKGIRLPQADANRNAIKLHTMISQSDTEPDESTKVEKFTLLRDPAAELNDAEEGPRADRFGRAGDEQAAEDGAHWNV